MYFYSKSTNSFYDNSVGAVIPTDTIKVTQEMLNDFNNGQAAGKIMIADPVGFGFVMINPDDLLTPEELAQRAVQQLKAAANSMLTKTDRFEHDVYQSKMKGGESDEFDSWRAELLSVALGDSSTMPTTPEFMQKFLEL